MVTVIRPSRVRCVREGYHATPRVGACIGVSVVWDHPTARPGPVGLSRAGEGLTPICPRCTQSRRSLWPRGLPYGHGPPFRPERVSGTSSTLSHGRRYSDQRASADPMDFDGPDMDELADAMERLQPH